MGNKPGVQERADAFKHIFDQNITANQEQRSDLLREAYRMGQRLFRQTLKVLGGPDSGVLHSYLGDLEDDAVRREGFLMGWQSDAYAHKNGLPFSVEGHTHIVLTDEDKERSDGYSFEDEGNSVLPGSNLS